MSFVVERWKLIEVCSLPNQYRCVQFHVRISPRKGDGFEGFRIKHLKGFILFEYERGISENVLSVMFQIKMKLLGKVVADHFIIVPYFHCLIDLKEVLPRFRCLERSDCLCLFCILLLKAKDKIVFCFSLRIQLQASDDGTLQTPSPVN